MVEDGKCPKCGEAKVEGRLNCIKCGATYPDAAERDLERDPEEQGD